MNHFYTDRHPRNVMTEVTLDPPADGQSVPDSGSQDEGQDEEVNQHNCTYLSGLSFAEAAEFYYDTFGWVTVPMGSNKKPMVKWSRYRMRRPDIWEVRSTFQGRRGVTGLAVISGPMSDGLVCRDFDELEAYERWAQAFPELARDLPTVETHRGRHVYFCNNTQARTRKFDDGELRAGCLCVLPPSRHPMGSVYRWLIAPSHDGLLVIDDVEEAGFVSRATERTERTQKPEKSETTETSEEIRSNPFPRQAGDLDIAGIGPKIEELIRSTLPTGEGQRHRAVFEFARALKGLVGNSEVEAKDLKSLVVRWHEIAKPIIRTKAFEETWIDFLHGWPHVRFAKGFGPIEQAFELAMATPPPVEVQEYDQEPLKLLASLCRELQRIAGEAPFFLACRKAGELVGVDHATASRWLFLMVQEGLLEEVKKGYQEGNKRQASRYRYLGSDLQVDPDPQT
jgi:hypothetical protein